MADKNNENQESTLYIKLQIKNSILTHRFHTHPL